MPASTTPPLEHHDAVGDRADEGEIVGDEQDREVLGLLQVLEQPHDRRLHGGVEGGGDLVADQDVRLAASARAIETRWRSPPESSPG